MSDLLDRRQLLLTPLLAAPLAAAQDKPAPEEKRLSPADAVLLQAVVTYPDKRIDETALGEIRGDIQQHLSRSTVLSSFPLKNGDEPGFVFAAYRAE
jgi:hypothetical protein